MLLFENVSFAYGKKLLFSNLNFNISDCRRCALIGGDGSGKSTLLKLMAGLLWPTSGKVYLPGQKKDSFFAYMPQQLGLYNDLTVYENLELFASLHGLNPDRERAFLTNLLSKTRLLAFSNRLAGKLSGGMRQKLALCTMLCSRPRLLILDEPTVGVDPLSRKELWQLIDDYLDSTDASLIFSTAYLSEAERCEQLLLLENGKLVYQGAVHELKKLVKGCTFCLGALPDKPRVLQKVLLALHGCSDLCADASPWQGEFRIQSPGPVTEVQLCSGLQHYLGSVLGGEYAKLSVRARDPSVEDAYIKLALQGRSVPKLKSESPGFVLNDTAVELLQVSKKFGSFTAVANSSFSVKRGEIFGLLGPNGAGKTTTFRMMCSLLRPSSGEIELNGLNVKKQKSTARLQIGYVSQRFSLYKKLSVFQNLSYFAQSYSLSGKEKQERIDKLLAEYDLGQSRDMPAGELPFGLQRNLSIACALLARPAILFLDEATSGADPLTRRIFWQRILGLAQVGTTVIVTTHFLEEAEYCDRFLIQDQGQILICGTPAEICKKGAHRISVEQSFMDLISHRDLLE